MTNGSPQLSKNYAKIKNAKLVRLLLFKNVKSVFQAILVVLLAYSVAGSLSNILAERTLGSVFRNLLPAMFFLFLILIVNTSNFTRFHLSDTIQWFRPKYMMGLSSIFRRAVVLIPSAFVIGLLTLKLADFGLLYIPLGMAVIGAYFYSCYCCLENRYLRSVSIFIMTQPFLSFFEWNFVDFFFHDWAFRTILWIPYSPTTVFMYSIFSIWLINQLLQNNHFVSNRIYGVIFLFFAVVLASLIINVTPIKEDFIGLLSVSLIPGLFFFLLVNIIKGWDDILHLFKIVFFSVLLSVLISFYFFWQKIGFGFLTDPASTYGIFYEMAISPGQRGILLALIIPLGIALGINAKEKVTSRIYFSLDIIAFLALFITFIRSSIAACIISVLVFLNRKRFVYIVFFIVFLYIASPPILFTFSERFHDIHTIGDIKLENLSPHRYLGWKAATEMIKDHPFIGIGYNQYEKAWFQYGYWIRPSYRGDRLVDWNMGNAHNLYYEIASNSGLIGLFAFLLLLGYIAHLVITPLKKKLNSKHRNIHIGLLSSFTAIFFLSFFGSIFFLPDPFLLSNLLFSELMGLLVAVNQSIRQMAHIPV